MKIVDTHVHIVVGNPDYHNPRDFPVEDLIARMDEADVAKAVVVQSKSGNGLDNPYPSDSARRFPDRLVAVCGGDLRDADAADTLRARTRDWGARGVRLFCDGLAPGEDRYDPIWMAATDLDVPVLLAGEVAYDTLPPLLRRFPDLKVVLDHLGKPDLGRGVPTGLARVAEHPNVFLKFSSYVIDQAEKAALDPEELFTFIVETFGAGRIVWGSNYPSSHEPRWTYQSTVDTARSLIGRYSHEEQEKMFAGTAIALWPDLGN